MGCGMEICGLTRLLVPENAPCVMIDFEKCPLVPGQKFSDESSYKITRIIKGTYNDYASINELEEKDYIDIYRVFFLEEAWNEIVKLYPRKLMEPEKDLIEVFKLDGEVPYSNTLYNLKKRFGYFGEYVEEWFSIEHFMDISNLNLDSWFNGYSQDYDVTAHRDRLAITQKCLDTYLKKYEDDRDEGDDGGNERDVFCYDPLDPEGRSGWWSKSFADSQGWKYEV